MSNDELRAMCERIKRATTECEFESLLLENGATLIESLLSRLDAEKAQEKYTITVDYNCAGDHWEAARLYPERLRYGVAANGKTAREALVACVSKIEAQQGKETKDA